MNEVDLAAGLLAVLSGELDMYEALPDARLARDLQDAGFLTRDRGVVLRFRDGSEFMVTVKQLQ